MNFLFYTTIAWKNCLCCCGISIAQNPDVWAERRVANSLYRCKEIWVHCSSTFFHETLICNTSWSQCVGKMSLSNRCMWYLSYQTSIWSQNKEMCQTLKILNDSVRENKKGMYAKCRCYCGCENKLRCKYIAEIVFPKILYRWILLQFLRSNKVHWQIFALLHEFDAWSEAKGDRLIWFKRSDVREKNQTKAWHLKRMAVHR